MLAAGVLAALVVLVALRSLRLRRVQDDLPDVTPEDRLAQAAPGVSVPVSRTDADQPFGSLLEAIGTRTG